jgi:hypothetical protein
MDTYMSTTERLHDVKVLFQDINVAGPCTLVDQVLQCGSEPRRVLLLVELVDVTVLGALLEHFAKRDSEPHRVVHFLLQVRIHHVRPHRGVNRPEGVLVHRPVVSISDLGHPFR